MFTIRVTVTLDGTIFRSRFSDFRSKSQPVSNIISVSIFVSIGIIISSSGGYAHRLCSSVGQ